MADRTTSGEPKLSKVEGIKEDSHGLYGPIWKELQEPTPNFSEESYQLLKHHGTYQQDDRDTRTERKKAGEERDWRFMLRTKFPGGAITAEQYLVCDDLCTKYGQNDLRVTSRQCFQFHGVVKRNLRTLIHDLNKQAGILTMGACGDVVRNTLASPVADIDPRYRDCGFDLQQASRAVSEHFLPKTNAYYDLWLDDEKVQINPDGTVTFQKDLDKVKVEEPIYGPTYLPRKFKIAFATDFDNCVDVYTNDVGVLAATENGRIVGYEILAGGGLGYTHRKAMTYARLGSPLAFVENADDIIPLLEAIVKVQRDFGGRADRRQARMKYLIDEWGMDKFREKVFEYAGRTYDPPREITPTAQPDHLGWHKQIQDGLNYVGVWVENGRIRDFQGSFQFKTGLREIVEKFKPSVRLTPHHNVVLANIKDEDVDAVQALLDKYEIPTDKGVSTIRRLEMACPALPLCGLAMAESERAMPEMMDAIENAGFADEDIIIRMSGCPNNCSRPRSAELGIVGSGSDRYIIYTGGDYLGRRLNEELVEKISGQEVPVIINQLLGAWKSERQNGERFGDWSHRVGLENLRERLSLSTA